MELAVPLLPGQIAAAGALHRRLDQWLAADRALDELARQFPGFDREATLLKVVALNALYGTNMYAVHRMARHAHDLLAETGAAGATHETVERLARLPPEPGETPRRFLSFASKFAHFFIDPERFPILDSYVVKMLRLHLGGRNWTADAGRPYTAFAANVERLRDLAGIAGGCRELDHYLWLAGQYQVWKRNPKMRLGRDVLRLFTHPTPDEAQQLAALLPAATEGRLKGES